MPVICNAQPAITAAVRARVPVEQQSQLGLGRIVRLQVTLDPTGRVTGTNVYHSSGFAPADAAAAQAAKQSTFSPAIENCRPVSQTVYFDMVVRPDYGKRADGTCLFRYSPAEARQLAQVQFPAAALHVITHPAQVAIAATIDPTGGVTNARVARSAGNMALDQAALDAAQQTTATYIFKVTFDPSA